MPDLYTARLGRLGELTRPSLLMVGVDDLVAPPPIVTAYADKVHDGTVHVFAESGHFSYAEEPDLYARTVTSFVLSHP